MKYLYYVLVAFALAVTSCQKEFENGGGDKPVNPGNIPSDFTWKTTQDVSMTVAAPLVDGVVPDYAVIRVYSSPILTDANIVAKGVATASASFRTAFTVPTAVKNLYVQTTLPDGTKSVAMVDARTTVDVTGAEFRVAAAPKIRVAEASVLASSMPGYPTMTVKTEADFSGDPDAIIREIQSGKNYQLGASWAYHAAPEYLIPAGVEITSTIDMNGGWQPYVDPVLYVAGKLTVSSMGIGQSRLVVLPGGEVTVTSLSGNAAGAVDKPSIYVFEGGKFTVENKPNLGSWTIVNCGTFLVNNDVDLNNGVTFYNTASATFKADELKCSNNVKFYNDNEMAVENLELNSNAEFYNCENGKLTVEDNCVFEANTTIYQRGAAEIDEMMARGTIWVNCYTVVHEINGEAATFNFASGVALDAETVEFNNTSVSMASGSVFLIKKYNAAKKWGRTHFTAVAGADPRAVVVITEKAYTSQGFETYFSGPMEVVYDNGADKGYTIGKKYLTDGAVLGVKQTVVIPESVCNGGKEPIDPDPEPDPEEYELIAGAPYTYCFEDNWPWFGDYDMNDAVVVVSIDRRVSKDGSKVSSLIYNWQLKAEGTTFDLAFAVQMDKVKASDVASVVSSYKGFGNGAFASQGLESGQEKAVIAFFNKTTDVLSSSNTWPEHPAAPVTKYTVEVVFPQPVAAADVLETAMNYFITAKARQNEIHMPGYEPTAMGVIRDNASSSDPYKFFSESDDQGNNNMMWALMIPGDFRYPAESKDIRVVYDYFMAWASSNGTQHQEWYLEEADESKLY